MWVWLLFLMKGRVCMRVCMHAHACMYACIHAHACMHACMRACTCMHLCIKSSPLILVIFIAHYIHLTAVSKTADFCGHILLPVCSPTPSDTPSYGQTLPSCMTRRTRIPASLISPTQLFHRQISRSKHSWYLIKELWIIKYVGQNWTLGHTQPTPRSTTLGEHMHVCMWVKTGCIPGWVTSCRTLWAFGGSLPCSRDWAVLWRCTGTCPATAIPSNFCPTFPTR